MALYDLTTLPGLVPCHVCSLARGLDACSQLPHQVVQLAGLVTQLPCALGDAVGIHRHHDPRKTYTTDDAPGIPRNRYGPIPKAGRKVASTSGVRRTATRYSANRDSVRDCARAVPRVRPSSGGCDAGMWSTRGGLHQTMGYRSPRQYRAETLNQGGWVDPEGDYCFAC